MIKGDKQKLRTEIKRDQGVRTEIQIQKIKTMFTEKSKTTNWRTLKNNRKDIWKWSRERYEETK